ncbi:DUF5343 domain-containing protein [Xanthomonas campestris pv. zingibericola]|uniref:DUF5343 domain-containing protein n=1 Tax=Xanthomonas TaxID=338 RepID=UPI00029730C7|nr:MULTISPECIES: DUF5343 domain-containing protein [Xanthomonas]EKQ61340.1 hypothetical protein WS7_09743 [Xanthomonas citri pv. malvacearum str. GSPB2388]MBV6670630.1 DUF5343 domain-containing protein [Xanthomonas euvesicatoria pv. alangii]MBV6858910.1 DUF5343 domain-containing protein [Xanthomonas campestris pv. zingibericola]
MALPESYTLKPSAIPAYFDAMLDAQPPERFSLKFLENLGFTSTNDRLFIGILKDLGFLNRDGAPQARYFEFLDKSQSKKIVADGIRDGYSELFAINTKANAFSVEDAKNKLRTLFAGKKTELVISNIAKTFKALCDYGDFTAPAPLKKESQIDGEQQVTPKPAAQAEKKDQEQRQSVGKIQVSGLQYHINIVLPETRDQAVFDAIFKSMREHLG